MVLHAWEETSVWKSKSPFQLQKGEGEGRLCLHSENLFKFLIYHKVCTKYLVMLSSLSIVYIQQMSIHFFINLASPLHPKHPPF